MSMLNIKVPVPNPKKVKIYLSLSGFTKEGKPYWRVDTSPPLNYFDKNIMYLIIDVDISDESWKALISQEIDGVYYY